MNSQRRAAQDFGWRDAARATVVFLALFLLYRVTLLPGLGGTEDTPKFQYIGAVLGTAHEPGYPLYTLLTHAWSRLPIGTLAFRINLFSAFWGATACALAYLVMRRLRIHPWVAFLTAGAMGLGREFWLHSVIAEVYTLAAALTAASILLLLVWDERRRNAWLFAAVAAAGLAFGAHLIFVGAIPALVFFVLSRFHGRPPLRVLAVCALLVAAGIAQYGYVWIRTAQEAEYLEARARSVRELADVMRAKQFESLAFSEPARVVVSTRIPGALRAIRAETGWAASLLAAAGAFLLIRRRRTAGGLIAGALAGLVLMLALLGGIPVGAIGLPAVALVWVLAACGIEGVREWLASRVPARLATAAAVAAAGTIAVILAAGNFTANDHRNDSYDTDYMRLLFDYAPPDAAIVSEAYTIDHMVEYQKLVTGRAGVFTRVPPSADAVAALKEKGVPVFAFEQGRRQLAHRFLMKPVELFGLTLDERLRALPRGRIVILAGDADPWPPLDSLGLAGDRVPRGRSAIVAILGSGIVSSVKDGGANQIAIAAGQPLGRSGVAAPAGISAAAESGRAVISIDGEPAIESPRGLAVVELGRRVEWAHAVLPERGMRVPVPMRERPLFEVADAIPPDSCTEVGSGAWVPLKQTGAHVLLGYLDNREPATAGLDVYLASGNALPVKIDDVYGTGVPELSVEWFARGPEGSAELAARLRDDGVTGEPALVAALMGAPVVTRVHVSVQDEGAFSAFRLLLGGEPTLAVARGLVDAPAGPRATLCALPLAMLDIPGGWPGADVYLGPGGEEHFGRGWGRAEAMPFGHERALSALEAELLLPLAGVQTLDMGIRIGGATAEGSAELLLNGASLGNQPYSSAWTTIRWAAPASAWTTGLNRMTIRVTPRVAGATLPRVRRITLAQPDTNSEFRLLSSVY